MSEVPNREVFAASAVYGSLVPAITTCTKNIHFSITTSYKQLSTTIAENGRYQMLNEGGVPHSLFVIERKSKKLSF